MGDGLGKHVEGSFAASLLVVADEPSTPLLLAQRYAAAA
jgi:hypothetical protein